MKHDYLENLKLALDLYDIPNKEEVFNKYQKRYEFGIEAGMDNEKIEEMLGNPNDIAKALWEENKPEDSPMEIAPTPTIKKGFNLIVRTVADDIILKKSSDDEIHISFDKVNTECYNVKNEIETGVLIDFYKKKYFSLNRKNDGKITIEIPNSLIFDEIKLTTTSGEIVFDELRSETLEMVIVSGNSDFERIVANEVTLQTVSGDISGYLIRTNETKLHSVSGDIVITSLISNIIRIDTVSGDIKIKEASGEIKSSSVTGNVVINGTEGKSLKKIVKGVFK